MSAPERMVVQPHPLAALLAPGWRWLYDAQRDTTLALHCDSGAWFELSSVLLVTTPPMSLAWSGLAIAMEEATRHGGGQYVIEATRTPEGTTFKALRWDSARSTWVELPKV